MGILFPRRWRQPALPRTGRWWGGDTSIAAGLRIWILCHARWRVICGRRDLGRTRISELRDREGCRILSSGSANDRWAKLVARPAAPSLSATGVLGERSDAGGEFSR